MTPEANAHPDTNSQGSLRRIAGNALAILQTRIELVGIELAEEKDRLLFSLFIGLFSMLLGLMALITLTVLIAVAFWETYRWQALVIVTGVYIVLALTCGYKAWSHLRQSRTIFSATLAELEKDRAALQSSS
jgi:uncharacterized membrane protein YqjE